MHTWEMVYPENLPVPGVVRFSVPGGWLYLVGGTACPIFVRDVEAAARENEEANRRAFERMGETMKDVMYGPAKPDLELATVTPFPGSQEE